MQAWYNSLTLLFQCYIIIYLLFGNFRVCTFTFLWCYLRKHLSRCILKVQFIFVSCSHKIIEKINKNELKSAFYWYQTPQQCINYLKIFSRFSNILDTLQDSVFSFAWWWHLVCWQTLERQNFGGHAVSQIGQAEISFLSRLTPESSLPSDKFKF